jgi:hypothetical protein
VSPRTRQIPLISALALLIPAGCGSPPQPNPTSPTYATASAAPVVLDPSLPPTATQPLPTPTATVPAYPTVAPTTAITTTIPAPTLTTTAPTEKSPTPTPSHAATCAAAPTRAQILALIKGKPGMPSKPLEVFEGPFCSGPWSFTTVEVTGQNQDEQDPLMVVATGTGSALTLIAAGSDVCTDQVQSAAPPGIRVLACGF